MSPWRLAFCLILLSLVSALPADATLVYQGEQTLYNDTVWSGDILVDGILTVATGATLEIRPGTQVRFTRPSDFDLQEHFKGSFGVYEGCQEVSVKVWFSKEVARYVSESTWHPSQELSWKKDGSLVAQFQLDGTREIKSWILSFGRHAEVLGPEELRGEMGEEVEKLLRTYSASEPLEVEAP